MSTSGNHWPLTAVGLAYSGYVPSLIDGSPGLIDYVEVPFELLRHDPQIIGLRARIPIVLHCASLSIGGRVGCQEETLHEIDHWLDSTNSPWIGEHLAFITAEKGDPIVDARDASGETYNVGYTVSPPMNREVLTRTVCNLKRYRRRFRKKILLENSPLYFRLPTTTMSQAEFFQALCSMTDVGVLLDLSHLYISSQNMEFDPLLELEKFPLEKVVEIHISGIDAQAGAFWDNHAEPAPDIVYRMLEKVLQLVSPRAVTLEYNWSLVFPTDVLLDEVGKVRRTIARCCRTASRKKLSAI